MNIYKCINKYYIFIDLSLIVMISLIAWYILYSCASIGFDSHHDGFMFKTALDLSRGKIMYRDTYSQYGILNAYIHSLFILLLGEKVLSIKIATISMYIIIFIMNYIIWKKFIGRLLAFLVGIISIFISPSLAMTFLPWSSVSALLFLIISSFFYILYIDHEKNIFLYTCILSIFLSFLCRQPVGIVLSAAFIFINFLLYLISKYDKKYLYDIYKFLIIMIVLSILFYIYLKLTNSEEDFWLQNISLMLQFAKNTGGMVDNTNNLILGGFLKKLILSLLGIPTAEILWTLLPIITLVYFLFLSLRIIRKKISKRYCKILILVIFSLASWHQYYPVTCIRHCYWASIPMLGIVAYCILMHLRTINMSKNINFKIYPVLLTIFFLLIISSQTLSNRINNYMSMQKNDYIQFYDYHFPYLNNIYMTNGSYEFYKSFHDALYFALKKYNKNVINQTNNGYFAVYSRDNYHPQFNNLLNIIYKNFTLTTKMYIADNKPIIISKTGDFFDDYHVFLPRNVNNKNYYLKVLDSRSSRSPLYEPVSIYVPEFVKGDISHIQIGRVIDLSRIKERNNYTINGFNFDVILYTDQKTLMILPINKCLTKIVIYLKPAPTSVKESIRTYLRSLFEFDLLQDIINTNDINFFNKYLYKRIDVNPATKVNIPLINNISDIVFIGFDSSSTLFKIKHDCM